MTRRTSFAQIKVRCFESADEFHELKGYREGNPLTRQSYRALVGYYNLAEKQFCCLEKENGNRCRHEHSKGWVVEKDDGTHTLLGKDCANEKFGADPRLIKDIQNYKNAIRQHERQEKLLSHLGKRTERTMVLRKLRTDLEAMHIRISDFLINLGPGISKRLLNMARSRVADVVVTAVRYREYVENGRKKTERSAFQHRLGMLNALMVVTKDSYVPTFISINNLLGAFDAAARLGDRPKRNEMDAVVAQLDDFDRVMKEGNSLLGAEAQFMSNNMELLCYLVDDRAERYKCARVAMRQSGLEGGKDQAKTWLNNREAELRTKLGIDQLEIY
ncbi:hypothetical protein MKD49_08355 [Herbaspirillum sp. WGmk3]|uniref:hypothetical protein n=1 Tax=Herbaspirillum sp. WGmk3 TaxID=2919925 RepID=UPI0020906C0E|nr:hypothetical protein [Herbaspirillum sp. WGmk3]MCO4856490.1 hypothetical protein [Herbaspirillum sp. WGmk3]